MVSLKRHFEDIDCNFGSAIDRLKEITQNPKYYPLDWKIYDNDSGWSRLSRPMNAYDDGIEYFLGWNPSASGSSEIQAGKNTLGVFALFLSESHMMVRYCALIRPTDTEIDKHGVVFYIDKQCFPYHIQNRIIDSLTKSRKAKAESEDQDRDREE